MIRGDEGDEDWGWSGWTRIVAWSIVGLALLILFVIACSVVLAFMEPTP